MTNFSSLGGRISAERERLGYTQARLAELCGVSREQIGKYERDKNSPGSDFLAAFVALGANINTLFPSQATSAANSSSTVAAGLHADVVRMAVETLSMWLEKHQLRLTPTAMADAVIALSELAETPEELLDRAPPVLRLVMKMAA